MDQLIGNNKLLLTLLSVEKIHLVGMPTTTKNLHYDNLSQEFGNQYQV